MPLSIRWSLDPGLLGALASYLAIYVWRWRRVRAQAGPRAASAWRLASFAGGILVLFVALASPIGDLGDQLFVFHMAQHVLLTDLAAVLLLLGLTRVMLRPVTALSVRIERRLGILATPMAGLVIYVGTLWLWHLPALYQLGLESPTLHPLQHISLLGAALVFWWFVLSPIPARKPLRGMAVVFYLGSAKVLTGGLAVLLTWSPVFFYDFYARQPRYLGLSAQNDQALAGALMMTVDSLVLTVAVVALFIRMLGESDREEDRLERYGSGSVAE